MCAEKESLVKILCCCKLSNWNVEIKITGTDVTRANTKPFWTGRLFFGSASTLHRHSGHLTLEDNYIQKHHTFRRGLSLVSIIKSYLQSSQQRVSELLIHWCRQAWWTKRRVPVQRHGVMRGLSSSPSQWQILTGRTARASEGTCQPAMQRHWFIYTVFSFSDLTFIRRQVYDLSGWGPGTYSLFPSAT